MKNEKPLPVIIEIGIKGNQYIVMSRADRLERVVERLEQVTQQDAQDRRSDRRKKFIGAMAGLLFTIILKKTSKD